MEMDALPVVLLLIQVTFLGVVSIAVAFITIGFLVEVPFVRTSRRVYPLIADALEIKENDVVYELGSGDGGFLLTLSTQFPHTRFVGIERNIVLHWLAQLCKRFFYGNPPNVSFRRENFFKTDFSETTKMYTYLLTGVMNRLLPTFERELKGARIASLAFQFKEKQPSHVVELSKKRGSHGEHLLYVYDF